MRVEYFATFRLLTGRVSDEFSIGEATALEMIERICEKYPSMRAELLTIEGELREGNKVLVNGRDIRGIQGLGTIIKNEDEICIFSAAGGG